VAFLDADDRWAPGKIAQQLAAGGNWPDAGFSFTDYDTVDDDGRPRGTNFAFFGAFRGREGKAFRIERPVTEIYGANVVGTSTALVRADLLRRLGGFDESLMFGEDWDLWLRLSGAAPVVCLHRPMTTYLIRRRGGLSTTTERRSDWLRVVAERHRDAVAGESPPRRARAAIAACRSSLVRGAADEALARGRRAQAVGLLALAMAASPSRRTAQEIAACVLGR
jgi:hypothetical protein